MQEKEVELNSFKTCIFETQNAHDEICHAQINAFNHDKKKVNYLPFIN